MALEHKEMKQMTGSKRGKVTGYGKINYIVRSL